MNKITRKKCCLLVLLLSLSILLSACTNGSGTRFNQQRAEELNTLLITTSVEQLREEYDEKAARDILNGEIFTVTDKTEIPHFASKHDYISMALYWWPDPESETGLPYIRRDGEVNPETTNESKYDRTRFANFVDALSTLSSAYIATGNDEYRNFGEELINAWFVDQETRMNPHLDHAQLIPGLNTGRDVGIIDFWPIVRVIDYINIFSVRSNELESWMTDYKEWLTTSDHGIAVKYRYNNIAVWHGVQVLSIANYLGKDDFIESYIPWVLQKIQSQIDADGSFFNEMQRTRSLSYSYFTLRAFLYLDLLCRPHINLLDHTNFEGGSLRVAIEFLTPYLEGERQWEDEQITDISEDTVITMKRLIERVVD